MRLVLALALLIGDIVSAATFGKVVVIGGEASDIAFDTRRNQVYVANYTGMRIDVLSAANNTLQKPIRMGALPAAIALSPDNRWLLVAHAPDTAGPGVVSGVT